MRDFFSIQLTWLSFEGKNSLSCNAKELLRISIVNIYTISEISQKNLS